MDQEVSASASGGFLGRCGPKAELDERSSSPLILRLARQPPFSCVCVPCHIPSRHAPPLGLENSKFGNMCLLPLAQPRIVSTRPPVSEITGVCRSWPPRLRFHSFKASRSRISGSRKSKDRHGALSAVITLAVHACALHTRHRECCLMVRAVRTSSALARPVCPLHEPCQMLASLVLVVVVVS